MHIENMELSPADDTPSVDKRSTSFRSAIAETRRFIRDCFTFKSSVEDVEALLNVLLLLDAFIFGMLNDVISKWIDLWIMGHVRVRRRTA